MGANYEEAQGAESKADPPHRLEEIIDEATQLRAILSKAVATAKERHQRQ